MCRLLKRAIIIDNKPRPDEQHGLPKSPKSHAKSRPRAMRIDGSLSVDVHSEGKKEWLVGPLSELLRLLLNEPGSNFGPSDRLGLAMHQCATGI
jgi:hypothetical protein